MIQRIMILSLLFMNVVSASEVHERLDILSRAVHVLHDNVPLISKSAADRLGKDPEQYCKTLAKNWSRFVPGTDGWTCSNRAKVLENLETPDKYADLVPLTLAALYSKNEELEVLLKQGVKADIKTENNGSTALRFAVELENIEAINLLVKYGADINQSAEGYCTMLMIAVLYGKVKSVERLLALGADINYTDIRRRTALTIAKEKGYAEIILMLNKASAKK